jgi:hypothetical protein
MFVSASAIHPPIRRIIMDFVFLALVVLLMAATLGLARLCDRLIGGPKP